MSFMDSINLGNFEYEVMGDDLYSRCGYWILHLSSYFFF